MKHTALWCSSLHKTLQKCTAMHFTELFSNVQHSITFHLIAVQCIPWPWAGGEGSTWGWLENWKTCSVRTNGAGGATISLAGSGEGRMGNISSCIRITPWPFEFVDAHWGNCKYGHYINWTYNFLRDLPCIIYVQELLKKILHSDAVDLLTCADRSTNSKKIMKEKFWRKKEKKRKK